MAVVVFEDKRRVVTALWLCPSLLSRLLVQSVAYQDGTRVLVRTEQRVGNGVGDVSFVRKRGPCLVEGIDGKRVGSEERCRWSVVTGDDGVDSLLVREREYCRVR